MNSVASSITSAGSSKSSIHNQRTLPTLNIYLNGPTCSGKTCLITSLIKNTFLQHLSPTTTSYYDYNLPVPYSSQTIFVKLNIWDLGGCDKYREIRVSAIKRKCQNKVLILVYDVTDMRSFKAVEEYMGEWVGNGDRQDMAAMILVANKIDLQNQRKRVVTTQSGLQLSKKHNILYIESSSKQNVSHIFLSALYLNQSLTFKSTTPPLLLDNYLLKLNHFIENGQHFQHMYKFDETRNLRDYWEYQIKLMVYQFSKTFRKLERYLQMFGNDAVEGCKAVVGLGEEVEELGKELGELGVIQEIICVIQDRANDERQLQITKINYDNKNYQHLTKNISQTPHISSTQPPYFSSTLPAPLLKSPQQDLKTLQQLLRIKQKQKQLTFSSRKQENGTKLLQQRTKIHQIFSKLKQKCKCQVFDKFVVDIRKASQNSVSVDARQSIKNINSNYIEPEGLIDQMNKLCQRVYKQFQMLNKLRVIVDQLQENFDAIVNYLQMKHQQANKQNNIVTSSIDTINKLIDFYIQTNTKQILYNSPIKAMIPTLAEAKSTELKQSLIDKLKQKLKQIDVIVEYLKKQIIENQEICRKVRIFKNERNVLKFWINKQIQHNKMDESGIKGFFSKIFK